MVEILKIFKRPELLPETFVTIDYVPATWFILPTLSLSGIGFGMQEVSINSEHTSGNAAGGNRGSRVVARVSAARGGVSGMLGGSIAFSHRPGKIFGRLRTEVSPPGEAYPLCPCEGLQIR